MGMVVRTNTMALNAYRQLGMNNNAVAKSLEKLSSGFRINRAADDAAGLAISEKMKAQIKGLETASANAQDGISLLQTAEGNLSEVHNMLNRMVELATKSANGTYTQTERDALQDEVDQLLEEIDRISQSANFNGAKLLDGSLSSTGDASSIKIGGIANSKVAGVAGKYSSSVALAAQTAGDLKEGDKLSFTVALEDNTSVTVDVFVKKNATGAAGTLVSADGKTTYGTLADATKATDAEQTTAFLAALKDSSLAEKFDITSAATGKFTFEAKEKGTAVPAIKAFDASVTKSGTTSPHAAIGVTIDTAPSDEGREILNDSITQYDGTNYEDAVFTINGHKFVLMYGDNEAIAGKPSDPTPDGAVDTFNATHGLGSDVTILVSDKANNKGLHPDDNNFEQNMKMIADVTGLTVVENATNDGIKLTPGTTKGGLVLQIGDTADDYNKMRVSISDMSAKGLGLKDLSIESQQEASDAIDRVKNAINTVSSSRASMGALQNRLEYTINNLDVAVENLSAANSRIRDTDMAKEMMNYTKMNVLVQSAQAMLAQANQQPQSVLQLLQ